MTSELLLEGRQNPRFLDGRGVFWEGGTANTIGRPVWSMWFSMFKKRRGSDFVGLGRPAGDDEKPLVGGSWWNKKSKWSDLCFLKITHASLGRTDSREPRVEVD